MTAYVVVDTKINDPAEYEKYKALAAPLVEKHGGSYLARGGDMHVVDEALWSPTRIVLLQFPDMATARGFLEGDEYAPVAALRHQHADSTAVIIDGV